MAGDHRGILLDGAAALRILRRTSCWEPVVTALCIRAVCAALAGAGIPFGLIPAGTGNLLAEDLTLLDEAAALSVAFDGLEKPIDLVKVTFDDQASDYFGGRGGDRAGCHGPCIPTRSPTSRTGWGRRHTSSLLHAMPERPALNGWTMAPR